MNGCHPQFCRLSRGAAALLVVALVGGGSCKSRSAAPPEKPASAQTAPTTPPPAPNLYSRAGERVSLPVGWVIDHGQTEKRSDQVPVHDFELPTDTQQPLNYDMLPCVFVTAKTYQVVIRRGQALYGFDDPVIGEHCYPAYMCLNPHCPGIAQKGSVVLFPFRALQDEGDLCPYCLAQRNLATETEEQKQAYKVVAYYLPQNKILEQVMFQQFYKQRDEAKGQ